jgi:hypothetical protein
MSYGQNYKILIPNVLFTLMLYGQETNHDVAVFNDIKALRGNMFHVVERGKSSRRGLMTIENVELCCFVFSVGN